MMNWPLAHPLVVDIETAAHPDADQWLDQPEADKRLTDPVKVAASIAEKAQQQRERASLDPNVGRIVALGLWDATGGTRSFVCQTEAEEAKALAHLWDEYKWAQLVTFNGLKFDLRYCVRRSQLLGVAHPQLSLSRWSKDAICDLYAELTFGDGQYDQGVMRRTLKAFARRFGVPVPADVDGAEIPALVAEGRWDAIRQHVENDVVMTARLAQRLGVIDAAVPV